MSERRTALPPSGSVLEREKERVMHVTDEFVVLGYFVLF